MNKKDFENLVWLYFDGEISEPELARLRRFLSTDAAHREQYAKLHRLHLATVVAVCGRTVDLRQVPPNLLTLVDTEAAQAPDARKIVAFAASFGAVAACAALAFVAFNDRGAPAVENGPAVATVAPATPAPAPAAVAPTPAPVEVVGRYAPTSPGAKALSESTKNLENITADTFSIGQAPRRQSPAFGANTSGFGMTQVGNDSETAPAVSPAVLTDDLFNLDDEIIGNPDNNSSLPHQPLIIR